MPSDSSVYNFAEILIFVCQVGGREGLFGASHIVQGRSWQGRAGAGPGREWTDQGGDQDSGSVPASAK
jgi:hypothetical protein